MSATLLDAPVLHDLDDFLTWLHRQECRFEFVEGRITAMAGGSVAHSTIQANLLHELGNQLRGGPCRAHGPDLLVPTARNNRRGCFPDASVTCSPEAGHRLTRPIALFEILSPDSEPRDRGVKWLEYKALPSLMHYVLIAQDEMRVEHYRREGDGWRYVEVDDLDGAITLDPPGVELRLADLYEAVELPAVESTTDG